jgi:phosphonoacetaldehyde hydrolase
MDFLYTRIYRGGVKAVVADLAGTTIDYGSCAPAGAFVELFHRNAVEVTQEEAREPMGMHKRDHIRRMLEMPSISAQWEEEHGRSWAEADLDRLYEEFIPLQKECLPRYGELVPGTVETAAALRDRGVRIASTTGYNREMTQIVLDCAAEQGFQPDANVCGEDVAAGRPAPFMIFRSMEKLGVYPPEAVVKIGDTLPDIESGLNAGVWTVGVALTGNLVGMGRDEYEALPKSEKRRRKSAAYAALHAAGAHFVVDSFADCLSVVDAIEEKMANEPRKC